MKSFFCAVTAAAVLGFVGVGPCAAAAGSFAGQPAESLQNGAGQPAEPVPLYDCVVVAYVDVDVDGVPIPVKFTLRWNDVPESEKDNLAEQLPESFSVQSSSCHLQG